MIQSLKKITMSVSFVLVLFMHVYFVLLLAAKPALAQETEQPPVEASQATEESAPEDSEQVKIDTKQFKFKINDKTSTVKIDNNGIQISNLHEDTEDADEDAERATTVISNLGKLNAVNQWSNLLEEVLVPIVLFLSAFGFAAYFVHAKSRTRREYLETIRAIAQSGQPIPPELLNNMNSTMGSTKVNSSNTTYDASAAQGVKYIFWGVGVMGFMLLISHSFAASIGFLFIVIGAFHIYTSQMIQKQKTTTDTVATTTTPESK